MKLLFELFGAWFERRAMSGYLREKLMCDQINIPSKKIRRRYGLNEKSAYEVWAILEKYCDGELIEKSKIEPLKTEIGKYPFEGFKEKIEVKIEPI